MKTTKPLLRIPFSIAAALFAAATALKADTFIGPTSPTNRFIIGTNEAVLIDTALNSESNPNPFASSLLISNITYTYYLIGNGGYWSSTLGHPPGPLAIAGPAEAIVPGCVIHMTRLTNTSMQMLMWAATNATNVVTVNVPAGKTFQIFASGCQLGEDGWCNATLSYPGQSFVVEMTGGSLLQGPVSISFDPSDKTFSTPCVLAAYWFVEDVFQNPNAVLSVGAGVANVSVQKSGDLTNWQPVAIFSATPGSNSFYRLQISQ